MIELGDVVPLSITVRDAAGAPADATTVTLSITQPDGTAATITNPRTSTTAGVYDYDFTPVQAGRHNVRWVATGANASAYEDVFDVAATPSRAIVSLANVKARLGKNSTATDEELRRVVAAATDWIESEIGPVVRQTRTRTVTPSGGMLFLDGPVISLTTVVAAYGYPGTYDPLTMFLDGDTGIVRPAYAGLPFCYPVTVTYLAGRAVVPALVQEAALDYIEWLWESRRGAAPLPLQGAEYEVTTPMTTPLRIAQKLAPYKPAVVA